MLIHPIEVLEPLHGAASRVRDLTTLGMKRGV
jgi:hypothetical protein